MRGSSAQYFPPMPGGDRHARLFQQPVAQVIAEGLVPGVVFRSGYDHGEPQEKFMAQFVGQPAEPILAADAAEIAQTDDRARQFAAEVVIPHPVVDEKQPRPPRGVLAGIELSVRVDFEPVDAEDVALFEPVRKLPRIVPPGFRIPVHLKVGRPDQHKVFPLVDLELFRCGLGDPPLDRRQACIRRRRQRDEDRDAEQPECFRDQPFKPGHRSPR